MVSLMTNKGISTDLYQIEDCKFLLQNPVGTNPGVFYFELVPKPQRTLRNYSLEIFNKMQSFLQIKLHLAICELSSSSHIGRFWDKLLYSSK